MTIRLFTWSHFQSQNSVEKAKSYKRKPLPENVWKGLVVFGGTKQNRTAVHGFADRCLATRPWYRNGNANIAIFSIIQHKEPNL